MCKQEDENIIKEAKRLLVRCYTLIQKKELTKESSAQYKLNTELTELTTTKLTHKVQVAS